MPRILSFSQLLLYESLKKRNFCVIINALYHSSALLLRYIGFAANRDLCEQQPSLRVHFTRTGYPHENICVLHVCVLYQNRKTSEEINMETNINDIIHGWITEKDLPNSKGDPYSVISYKDERGVIQTCRCYSKACKRLNVDDPVRFFKTDGFIDARVLRNYIGRVVTPENESPYIEHNSGARYTFDEKLDDVKYVVFFEKTPYDAETNTYGQAIGLIPKSFPVNMIQVDLPLSSNHQLPGTVLKAQKQPQPYVGIRPQSRQKQTSYSCFLDCNAEWFFEGDNVVFEMSSEPGKNGYYEATYVKKCLAIPNGVSMESASGEIVLRQTLEKVPSGLFSEELNITNFQKLCAGIKTGLKSRAYGLITSNERNSEFLGEFNISADRLVEVLKNITANLYLDDPAYSSLLSRFKPFFDKIIPYLYAAELGDNPDPERLESCFNDYCDFLNTVKRTENTQNQLGVVIDPDRHLYNRFAEMVRYYIFDHGNDISVQSRLAIAIALTDRADWANDDTKKLFSGTDAEIAFDEPHRTALRDLYAQTDSAMYLSEYVCKAGKFSESEAMTNAIAREIVANFQECEITDWEAPENAEDVLLRALYKAAKSTDCQFDPNLIAALMILYLKDGQPCKVRFLYSHFIRHREVRTLPVFSNIFDIMRKSKVKDKEYSKDVVYYAFTHLPAPEVYKFILWASRMFVSPWASNFNCDVGNDSLDFSKPTIFAYYFVKLLLAPESEDKWSYISNQIASESHITNRILSCVCCIILYKQFNRALDVPFMHQTIVTLLQSTNNYLFPGLIYHVFELLQDGAETDDEIAQILYKYVTRKNIAIRKEATPYTDKFCNFCLQKIKANKNTVYADLLVFFKGTSLSPDEICLTAPLASSGEYISNILLNEYRNPNYRAEAVTTLLDALKNSRGGVSHTNNAFYDVWSKVIVDDHTYYSFLDDEDFYTLRQACIEILEDHPKTEKLKEWLNSNHSLCLKLLLCSHFVGIYTMTFKSVLSDVTAQMLCDNENLKIAYLNYIQNAVSTQLISNTSYGDFYIYERYVKLLIAHTARDKAQSVKDHGASVLNIAKQNGHEELLNGFGFDKCIESLNQLCSELETGNEYCRSHMLFALLTENTDSYFAKHADIDIPSLKSFIRHLDYREIHKNFFLSNCQCLIDDDKDAIARATKQAALLSDEMHGIFECIRTTRKKELASETAQVAARIFAATSPMAAVFEVLNMDDAVNLGDFWHYVIFARQFPEKVIGCARTQILMAQEASDERALFALDLLSHMHEDENASYYYGNAQQCYNYLNCLHQYLTKSRVPLTFVNSIDPNNLPKPWKNEALRFIKQYSEKGAFKPDAILNHSYGSMSTPPEFLSLLQQELKIGTRGKNGDQDHPNIVRALQKIKETKINSPEYQNALVDLCSMVNDCDEASVSLKLKVFLEFLERYSDSNEIRVKGYLEDLLPQLSLENWLDPDNCNAFSAIFQSGFDSAYSFCQSIENITSETDMLCKLENADITVYGRNNYLDLIVQARDNKIRDLKTRKLTVNHESTCNGYAYFSVKNEGHTAIRLSSRLKVDNAYIDAEVGLDTLRPGWTTGFRYKVGSLSELSVTILGESENALPLYRATHKIEDCVVDSIADKKFYDERPLREGENLWGRDKTIELIQTALNVFGYAVITGPSRVGKTSIINRIKYMAEQNGDSVTIVGNTDENGYNKSIGEYINDTKSTTGANNWLIFDEFQRVINPEKKTVDEQSAGTSATLISDKDIDIISRTIDQFEESTDEQRRLRIIFCGSDRFHKELSTPHASWSKVLRIGKINGVDNWITVSQIEENDFKDMLCDLNDYTDNALEAAALYSSQIPIYGKMICNRAISDAKNSCIFCYDIATAVNKMFDDKAKASRIIDPVIKGMERRDVLMLEYLARALEANDTDTRLNELKEICGENTVNSTFQYAREARLLLNNNKEYPDFSSVFFYKVFRQNDESNTMENILEELAQKTSSKVNAILDQLKEVSEDEKWAIIHKDSMLSRELSNKNVTKNYYTGDHVEGNKLSIALHVQSINNLRMSLRDGDPDRIGKSIVEFYDTNGAGNILSYLPEDKKATYKNLIELGPQDYTDADEETKKKQREFEKDMDVAAENRLQALLSCITFDDMFKLSDKRWEKLLGIKNELISKLRKNEIVSTPLIFALSLHNLLMILFDKAPDDFKEKIDFSPVALLYSKIIEEVLNTFHAELYEKHLNDASLVCMDKFFEALDKNIPHTIGEFHYPISGGYYKEVEICRNLLAKATTRGDVSKWKLHATFLTYLLDIRNRSAHKTTPVSIKAFEKFIKIVFVGGKDLVNELVSEQLTASFEHAATKNKEAVNKEKLNRTILNTQNGLPKDSKGDLMLIFELANQEL